MFKKLLKKIALGYWGDKQIDKKSTNENWFIPNNVSINSLNFENKVLIEYNDNPSKDIKKMLDDIILQYGNEILITRTFTIPVGGLSKENADKHIAGLIADYKSEVNFDSSNGEVIINGNPHIPYQKEYWIPTKD